MVANLPGRGVHNIFEVPFRDQNAHQEVMIKILYLVQFWKPGNKKNKTFKSLGKESSGTVQTQQQENNRQKYKIRGEVEKNKQNNRIKLGQTKQNQMAGTVAVQRVLRESQSITGFTQYRLMKSDQHSDKDKTEMQSLNTLRMTRYNDGQVCENGEGEWQTGERNDTIREANHEITREHIRGGQDS